MHVAGRLSDVVVGLAYFRHLPLATRRRKWNAALRLTYGRVDTAASLVAGQRTSEQ